MRARTAAALAALLAPTAGGAFVLLGSIWPDGQAPLHTGAIGPSFQSALVDAAHAWEAASDFDFLIDDADDGACLRNFSGAGPLADGVEFDSRDCDGADLGSDTLAVTQSESDAGAFVAVGMVANDALAWDVYDGPWQNGRPDFRRVALHELGHWLGLDHEDAVPSIMSSFAGDIDTLQPDDIAGVRFLYGPSGPPPPPPPPVLPPDAVCRRDQLRALARVCRQRLGCEAAHARHPDRDPLGTTRDACLEKAGRRFFSRFDAATLTNPSCLWKPAAADALAELTAPADALAAGLETGADPQVEADDVLRKRLLQRAGRACSDALAAEALFAKTDDPAQRSADRSRARERFVDAAAAAIARAEADGVTYTGTAPLGAADQLDALADDLAARAAGQ